MNNFWSFLVVAYCLLDYIFGLAATAAVRHATGFDIRIAWVSVQLGWTELTVQVGPVIFSNPKRFSATPFLVKIGRFSARVKPKSFLPWFKKEAPMLVENVEIEGMKLHLERDGRGDLNVWAALGMDEQAGAALTADVSKHDVVEVDAFEEDGTDEPLAPAPAPAADGEGLAALGRFAVSRVCLRGCRYDIDAFLRASKTRSKDAESNIIRVQCLECMDLRGPKRQGYPGLPLDEIISKVVMRCVRSVTATNKFTLLKAGVGAGVDQTTQAVKKGVDKTARAVGKEILNATQHTSVKVNKRLRGVAAAAESLKITAHAAKHLGGGDRAKPAAYLKLQIGKKGVKTKTRAATGSANPEWQEKVVLRPVEALDLDLRVQVYDRHLFGEDKQLGSTLKIPLSDLVDAAVASRWYMVPQGDGVPFEETKNPAVQLSLELVGVKETFAT